MRRTKSGWPLEGWVPPEVADAPIDRVSTYSDGAWAVRMQVQSIGMVATLQTALTPRDEALLNLTLRASARVLSAQVFGLPITHQQARDEIFATMSDAERALIAQDVTPQK